MTVWKWSTNPTSNDAIDDTINWREAQAPSSINNSARAMMAAIKKWWLDTGGMVDTAGTSSAYTVTTNQGLTSLTDGFRISVRMHATNAATPTLQIDSTTAKAITVATGTPASAGMFLISTVQTFVYDAGDDAFRATGYLVFESAPKTGAKMDTITAGPYPGWVMAAGKTIGNASSGGTERANADTQALFIAWHKETKTQNALYPIQDSSGSSSTRTTNGTDDENALADFNANKRLPLPKLNGRVFAALDNLGGTPADVVTNSAADIAGGTVGAATHTLVAGEVPQLSGSTDTAGAHAHGYSRPFPSYAAGGGAGGANVGSLSGDNTGSAGSHSHAVTVNSGGGGSHNNMQPTFFGYVFIKL